MNPAGGYSTGLRGHRCQRCRFPNEVSAFPPRRGNGKHRGKLCQHFPGEHNLTRGDTNGGKFNYRLVSSFALYYDLCRLFTMVGLGFDDYDFRISPRSRAEIERNVHTSLHQIFTVRRISGNVLLFPQFPLPPADPYPVSLRHQ